MPAFKKIAIPFFALDVIYDSYLKKNHKIT
jgi:hypothetical protein